MNLQTNPTLFHRFQMTPQNVRVRVGSGEEQERLVLGEAIGSTRQQVGNCIQISIMLRLRGLIGVSLMVKGINGITFLMAVAGKMERKSGNNLVSS